jgi:hypothetical protein
MKITYTILLFLIALACKSQDYIPFPDSNASWKVVWALPFPDFYSQHYNYLTDGDTSINNLEYIKLKKIQFNIFCYKDTLFTEYVGAYRNDIMASKVYFVPEGYQQEQLLYDFSLNVGDTVPQTYQNFLYPELVVEDIELISIEGQLRNRFTYWNPPDPLNLRFYVYDGIGSDFGPLEYYALVENPFYLKCFYESDTLKYLHPGDSLCGLEIDTCLQTRINPIINDNTGCFKIFDSQNQIIIKYFDKENHITLKIFDLSGNLIINSRYYSDMFILNKSGLRLGIYVLVLLDNNQCCFSKKIIINH